MTYRENGFQGLRPMNRQKRRSQAMPENFDELLKESIQLRAYWNAQPWRAISTTPASVQSICEPTGMHGRTPRSASASHTVWCWFTITILMMASPSTINFSTLTFHRRGSHHGRNGTGIHARWTLLMSIPSQKHFCITRSGGRSCPQFWLTIRRNASLYMVKCLYIRMFFDIFIFLIFSLRSDFCL